MSDDLRARILDALNTTRAAFARDESQPRPWQRHDQHNYEGGCALCRGEADTLADAVMAVLAEEFQPPIMLAVERTGCAWPEQARDR